MVRLLEVPKAGSGVSQANQPPPTEGQGAEEVSKVEVEGDGDVPIQKIESIEVQRDSWGSKVGYVLTLVGYAVGFGNIWRFPYLLHSNGGAAFLIPYCLMLGVCGIPLFFLELAIGQRLRKGALGCWNEISPYLGGLGIACGLTCYFVEIYYNTLIAWVLAYFFESFRETLPWTNCSATHKLWPKGGHPIETPGGTVDEECDAAQQASKYYWYRRTLDSSEGITSPGNFNPFMLLYLFISWVLIWAILIKGIKSSEKVVYFTALFPYFTLACFFVANFFQDGWMDGYTILFKPDFTKLSDPDVWMRAGSQIFFSLGVGFGCLIVFASYLPSNNNCYKDAVRVSIINCSTSLLASIVIFPILGSQGNRKFDECCLNRKLEALLSLGKATPMEVFDTDLRVQLNKDYRVDDVDGKAKGWINNIYKNGEKDPLNHIPIELYPPLECDLEEEIRNSGSGTALVFIAFSEAALNMPCPQFWCALFFFMLLTMGVDSSFGWCEGAIAAIEDMKVVKWARWAINSAVCGSLFLISIMFAWGWGMYILNFLDQFLANWSLLLIGLFETIGIAWVYGLATFAYDIKLMTGSKPDLWMLLCWKFITPVTIIFILLMSVIQQFKDGYTYDVYNKKKGDIESQPYPVAIVLLGYILLLGVICWVPGQAALHWFGHSILKMEKPAYFPEEELRQERQMSDDDDVEFDDVDKLLMGKSIDGFKSYRERSTLSGGNDSARESMLELNKEAELKTKEPSTIGEEAV